MECYHEDGWVTKEEFVINTKWENDNNIIIFECNTIGCGVRKQFKFDIINLVEVKEWVE